MEREQGHFPRNHVIWLSPETQAGVEAVDRWLEAVEADDRDVSLEQKVADDRPADVHDKCVGVAAVDELDVPGVGKVCQNPVVRTRFNTIRGAAGGPFTNDVNKCQLKPLRRMDFLPIEFTDKQWTALEAAFSTGICDWSKPGVSQTGTTPWLTYQDADGGVVYGGKPLGPAPAGSGTGWTGSSFDSWRDATRGGTSG
jgi:hypothetical protein